MSRDKSLDLEAVGFFVRRRMHQAGAQALEQIPESFTRAPLSQPLVCCNSHLPARMESIGFQEKGLRTILGGEVPYRRRGYRCSKCGVIRYPADEALNVVETRFSPGVRRMMARMGAKQCFAEGAEDLQFFAEVRVDAKDMERVAENTGRLVEEWAAQQRTLGLLAPPEEKPDTLYIEFDGTGIPMRAKELDEGPQSVTLRRRAGRGGTDCRGRRGSQEMLDLSPGEFQNGAILCSLCWGWDSFAARDIPALCATAHAEGKRP